MAATKISVAFFATPGEFRRWLAENHATARELWVGFHKKKSGRPSMTWPDSVDEALCYGWIDGIRKSIDESRYKIRFTPRKPSSNWSLNNIKRARALIREKRMQPAGLRAFEARRGDRSGVYSFEQRRNPQLDPDLEARLRKHRDAWRFFESQPPGYQRLVAHWIMSAKRPETRSRRLDILIADSARGLRIAPLRR